MDTQSDECAYPAIEPGTPVIVIGEACQDGQELPMPLVFAGRLEERHHAKSLGIVMKPGPLAGNLSGKDVFMYDCFGGEDDGTRLYYQTRQTPDGHGGVSYNIFVDDSGLVEALERTPPASWPELQAASLRALMAAAGTFVRMLFGLTAEDVAEDGVISP